MNYERGEQVGEQYFMLPVGADSPRPVPADTPPSVDTPQHPQQPEAIPIQEDEVADTYGKDDEPGVPADLYQIYVRQVKNAHPPIGAEREVELGKTIEVGVLAWQRLEQAKAAGEVLRPQYRRDLMYLMREGKRDTTILVEANVLLVPFIAKKYVNRGLTWQDLIQEGNVGLVTAVMKFDYTRDNKFGVHAAWWIRHHITRALSNHARAIRLPVRVTEKISTYAKAVGQLQQKLGRQPTIAEIAKETNFSQAEIRELDTHKDPLSFDIKVDEDGELTLGDSIEDRHLERDINREARIQQVLDAARESILTKEEQIALFLTQDLKDTSEIQAARAMSCSVTKLKSIVAQALAKLAHPAAQVAPSLPIEGLSTSWRNQAACSPEDLSDFFSMDSKARQRAEALCAGCIVRKACLIDLIGEKQPKGMRAGLSAGARRRLNLENYANNLT